MAVQAGKQRLTAVKCRVSDVVGGKYVKQEGFSPNYVLTAGGRRLSRVRIMASVVVKYDTEDRNYSFITLDDGTETIRVKAFKDVSVLDPVEKGMVVDVIGKVREWQDERYIVPEAVYIVKELDREALRRLEIVKSARKWARVRKAVLDAVPKHDGEGLKKAMADEHGLTAGEVDGIVEAGGLAEEKSEEEESEKEAAGAKRLVLKVVQELDEGEGADVGLIIEKAGVPENVAETALNELLNEGSCYEPRAGRIKVL